MSPVDATQLFAGRGARPLVLGHRGAAALSPENTLAAVRSARLAGADGIEIDVRSTRDGVLILFHDETLERAAGRSEGVADLDWSAMGGVRVGGEPLTTLAEALNEAEGLLVNVEIKSERSADGERLARQVAREIDSRGTDGVLVSAFDPRVVRAFARASCRVPVGLLLGSGDSAADWERLRGEVGATAIHPHVALCDSSSVARWKAAGLAVVAWTANEPAQLRDLHRWGADAVISDDPMLALAALGRIRA